MRARQKRLLNRRFAQGTMSALVVYFVFRVYLFIGYLTTPFSIVFGFFLLLAESHAILQSLGYASQIVRIYGNRRRSFRRRDLHGKEPGVTVLVPARNEPLDVLNRTFISIVSMGYRNKRVVFLDGSDEDRLEANARLASRFRIEHFVPPSAPPNKASIVNAFLPKIMTPYLCIFDADQNPMPAFLSELVSVIESSRNIAFVQTPQLYTNIRSSRIAMGAAMQQSIFFENICEAKGSANAMFCCGTNFLLRTHALREVGGFDETSVTEDFATSIRLHALGYRSIYYPHVRVFGMAPETLPAYFKQQFRWAAGTLAASKNLFLMVLLRKVRVSPSQLWEYGLSGTYYLTGWSFFILMLAPVLYLLFGVPSYFADPAFYLLCFVPYYVMSLLTFYSTMHGRNYAIRDVFLGTVINSLNFPILMKASVAVLLNVPLKFHVTEKGGGGKTPWVDLWPWVLMIALLLVSMVAGILRFPDDPYASAINMLWCGYHATLLSFILIVRNDRAPGPQAARAVPLYE